MEPYQYELPKELETDEYEDILTELIGSVSEYSPSAAGEIMYEHVANFDYLIDKIWFYGSAADRKAVYIDNRIVFIWAHGAYETSYFGPDNLIIPKGSVIKIVLVAASSGYHGAYIYGKKIYLKDLEMYRK
ncbi:MAG: hypothetical protein ACW99F_19795 [Candidatus Hodarchaeales archaeon]|jgi:hypothetical protein